MVVAEVDLYVVVGDDDLVVVVEVLEVFDVLLVVDEVVEVLGAEVVVVEDLAVVREAVVEACCTSLRAAEVQVTG